jgi:cob(I)alamin adenosyltransferase
MFHLDNLKMSLYTKKGDDGHTGVYGCDQRISKSSIIAEALGSLDEVNSYIGVCKVKSKLDDIGCAVVDERSILISEILDNVQQNLFIIQAEVAGANKVISDESIKKVENIIDYIEKELPEIKSFFVPGGVELSSLLDFARTLARKSERRVVSVKDEEKVKISEATLVYLNRLSSLLYALTRLINHKSGINEKIPHY